LRNLSDGLHLESVSNRVTQASSPASSGGVPPREATQLGPRRETRRELAAEDGCATWVADSFLRRRPLSFEFTILDYFWARLVFLSQQVRFCWISGELSAMNPD
jgi:hypothetical protein